MRDLYRNEVTQVAASGRNAKMDQLRRRRSHFQGEEARLARLLILGKIIEETYDQLRSQWMERAFHVTYAIQDLGLDARSHSDDLGAGLTLLTVAHRLFG